VKPNVGGPAPAGELPGTSPLAVRMTTPKPVKRRMSFM
jgi:hypothetical protein